MPRGRQRTDEETSDRPKKAKTLGSTSETQRSVVATVLLMKWAWGVLSAPDVQELAMAIKLGGNNDDEILELASLGAHGTSAGHIHRDLVRKFCPVQWSPAPMLFRFPYKDHKGKKDEVLTTDSRMYLCSDWMRSLASNPDLEFEYDALFGISSLDSFWNKQKQNNTKLKHHPVLKQKGYKHHAIPIYLHGDGAAYQHNDSLVTVSFCGCMKEGEISDTNLFLVSWSKNICVKGKHGTWDYIWEWLVWDFNQLFNNRYDSKDPWGEPLPEEMAARAGQPILPDEYFVVVWGVHGDMDYFCNDLGLPHYSNAPPKLACGWCSCSKGADNSWFDFREGVPWHRTPPN